MARLEAGEREIGITQSALDRRQRDGKWEVWTNDNYWHRRLRAIGAKVVEETETGVTYQLDFRQVLLRKVPAPRVGPRRIEFLRQGRRRQATEIRAEGVAVPAQ